MKKCFFGFLLLLITVLPARGSADPFDLLKVRDFIFEYDIVINDIPSENSDMRVWIPYPTEAPYQNVMKIGEKSPLPSYVKKEKKYGNKIVYYHIASPKAHTIKVSLRYHVNRFEFINKPGNRFGLFELAEKEGLEKYLLPSRLVTVSPRVKKLAASITQGKKRNLDKARAIYDYVFENISYDKTAPGWGRGDTERVCDVKKGNCTDFHSLFISLARASGIPARFVIGALIPEENESEIASYHCWAEFYIEDKGWIPVDISEAWKDKSKYEYYFGALDENRIGLSKGRDLILEPAQDGGPLNYFVYPYVEIDGKPFENVDVIFRYKDNES